MAGKAKRQKKKKRRGQSVQDLIGIKRFTKYGLLTNRGEMLFFLVAPTNISVLSRANIDIKIHHLTEVLSSIPNIEIVCTDASECFDSNMVYLQNRLHEESNAKIRRLLEKDAAFLDDIQVEMATARQFLFAIHVKGQKEKQTFETINTILKAFADAKFEGHRMNKADIKRFLALYFEASVYGDQMPDVDGSQYLDPALVEEHAVPKKQRRRN